MAKAKVRRAIIREWMSLAREKRQSSQQALASRKPRSNDTAYHAAGERRTTSSWDGCGHAPDDPDLRQETAPRRQIVPMQHNVSGKRGRAGIDLTAIS
jgi:hypothetical protein